MKYLVSVVNNDATDEAIDRMHAEFYSTLVSLANHSETVVSPWVMLRMALIGYLSSLVWREISDEEARNWIASHRQSPM